MNNLSIGVHVGIGDASDRRTDIACDIAEQFKARLTGVSCEYIAANAFANGPVSNQLLKLECDRVAEVLAKREARFRFHAQKRIARVEWRESTDYLLARFLHVLRSIDLFIIGPQRNLPLEQHLEPANIAINFGRPVLFIPDRVRAVPFRRAIVAWKDGRESRRAITDALPFLKRASSVEVLGVCEDEQTPDYLRDVLSEVCSYLSYHGIAAELKTVQRSSHSSAEEVLLHAQHYEPDFIVAGAYGRNQLSEWVFGGVTKTLFAEAPCACLVSH